MYYKGCIHSYKENNKVLDRINKEGNESNPGLARFYGDTSGYSSYVKKNDFGDEAENNEKKEMQNILMNYIQGQMLFLQ